MADKDKGKKRGKKVQITKVGEKPGPKKTTKKREPKVGKVTSSDTKEAKKVEGSTPLAKVTSALKKFKGKALDHFVPLDEESLSQVWPHIPLGNIKLDYLIGGFRRCPGIPRQGITNIYGPEHSGKTSFALHACASACAMGGCVGYIDFEHVLDVRYAYRLGVPVQDPDRFVLYQPETLEQGVIAISLMAAQGVDLIVLDSVGAAVPMLHANQSDEAINKGESKGLGLQARKWSEFIPKFQQKLRKGNAALIAISQTRSNIGGKGVTTQGGRSWKFYSLLRLELKFKGSLEATGVYNPLERQMTKAKIGSLVQAIVRKSKVSPTLGSQVTVDVVRGYGFDPLRASADLAKRYGIISVGGSWVTWNRRNGDPIKVQGWENFIRSVRPLSNVKEELNCQLRPLLEKYDLEPWEIEGDSQVSEEEKEVFAEDEEEEMVEKEVGEYMEPKKK
jgi:recombination protein RecA